MDIGIVFGGGFARGAAQLGFLRGMLPFLNRSDIKLLSCSSSGALTGLALSADRLDYGEQIYRHTNITSISNLRLNLKNKLVDQVIDSLIKGGRVDIPLYVTGTCLNTLSTHYFYLDSSKPKEELYEAMNITLTFPFVNGVFRRYGKKFYLDGGATDNIPVYPFLIKHVDLLLILHNYPRYLPPAEIVNLHLVAYGQLAKPALQKISPQEGDIAGALKETRRVFFSEDGWRDTPIYDRAKLGWGAEAKGPLVVEEPTTATVVCPGQKLSVDQYGNLIVETEAE